jgi:trans-aconitate methyltransferase
MPMSYNFDGEKYKYASKHQKEWADEVISEFNFDGNEKILDLGCGDGNITLKFAKLVPYGFVIGIDNSEGMINTAKKINKKNLKFILLDINKIDFINEFDLVFSNATLHWIKTHNFLLSNVHKSLKKNGIIRFNFAGHGNCSNFFRVIREVIKDKKYRDFFKEFNWPWYMPDIREYEKLLSNSKFHNIKVWTSNKDRFFENDEEMIRWIEQPSIVPFMEKVDDKLKVNFKKDVIDKMIDLTKAKDDRCFETFRRINVYAEK